MHSQASDGVLPYQHAVLLDKLLFGNSDLF